MTDREKPAKLLCKAHNAVTEAELENDDMSYADALEIEADVLIAHGVVISKMETTTQRWIPVTERLPEPGEIVLCYTEHHEMMVLQKDAGKYYAWAGDRASYAISYVTHWMPLPAPPEEE